MTQMVEQSKRDQLAKEEATMNEIKQNMAEQAMPSTDENIKKLEQRVTDAKNDLFAAESKAKEAKTA